MTINLTNEQLKNLMIFLNRVQLQGNEVRAFVEIVSVLSPPQIRKVENGLDKPNKKGNNGDKKVANK